MLAYSDRGKPFKQKSYDFRDPTQHFFPALNWNTNEFSSAIGISSLKKLEVMKKKRMKIVKKIEEELGKFSRVCKAYNFSKGSTPFFLPVFVDRKKIKCSKKKFAKAVKAEGISLNFDYKFLIENYKWARKYLTNKVQTPNAKKTIDNSFNLYINEKYTNKEIKDIISAILKVEKYYLSIS